MKKLLLFASLLCGLLPMQAENITVDGVQRNYIVYAPSNLGSKRPLLISCHGMNQDANYQKNMLKIETVADTAKFVTVFPNGIDKGWDISGNRDINFVTALIDAMVTRYDIDPNRVYLSGKMNKMNNEQNEQNEHFCFSRSRNFSLFESVHFVHCSFCSFMATSLLLGI
ncbi:MAG: PHB depolymerase family esterase [Bacteroidaceae bacterium]|nr:PHB depolymerase family esterase [Bacteroidaceae bacterium]